MPRSLATTCGITVVFSSSSYLDVSVQRVRSSFRGTIYMVGCPIRISADYRLFAPPRGFSQLITSFFALQSLGIPRMPLFVFIARNCVSITRDRYVSTLLFYQCFDNVFSLLVVFLCFHKNLFSRNRQYVNELVPSACSYTDKSISNGLWLWRIRDSNP